VKWGRAIVIILLITVLLFYLMFRAGFVMHGD